nr:hypothetical protein [Tanacetum cinerariifolium]
MVAYLEKSDDNKEFHQIVDFLSSCSITYALTVSPTIYASYIKQFWNTASSKIVNSMKKIHALVDGKAVVISESLVRSDILFDDKDGITCLTNDEIFENLALMGYEPLSTKLNFQKDEAVNQEEGDIVERAITIDASLEAAQDSDNITKTQTTAMPNVDIPQGIDTSGRPRSQETIGGTSAQTRSERVLEQPNKSPLTEGHTSGSREGRLEENIKLTDIVPTPMIHLSQEVTHLVTQLETELLTTKAVYNKAFITLTNRVKKLESQLKQKISMAVIHSSDKEGPREVQETAKHSRGDDDKTLAETLLNIKKSLAKDKRKGIMQETELPKKLKKKEIIQPSLDVELAQKLQLDQRKESVPKEIDWNDPQVLTYHALQNRPFSKAEVRKNMIMIRDQVYTFVPKDFEIEREVMKRAGFDLQQGSSKKQRLDQQTDKIEEEAEAQGDSDQEVKELKLYMRIILKEDIAIEAIPLSIKPLVIIEEDLKTLWKLVKDKYGNTRPEEGYERVLCGDLKVMFEPDIESEIQKSARLPAATQANNEATKEAMKCLEESSQSVDDQNQET